MGWGSSLETAASTSHSAGVGKSLLRIAICIIAVLAATAVLFEVPLRDRSLSALLIFLFVVLIVAALWGFRYAIFESLLSALAFSLLAPPVGRLQIRDLRDVYVLIAFLVIGITTGHLSSRARKEALKANQRHAEAVAAQERFRDLVNSVEGIVWEADARTFVFSFVNDQAERVLGYRPEQWLNEPTFWKDHLHPEDREWAVQFCTQATADKRTYDLEYRMIAADGRVVWLRDIVTVVIEKERPRRLRGVMVDITERKRGEQARQDLEEQLRAAFESNPTMYFIVDDAAKIVSVNPFGAEQLGYSVSELVGQSVLNVFYEPDRSAILNRAKECFEHPGRMMQWEARKIRKDGTTLWVRETANAVVLQKRPVLLVICENITEQKRAEGAARRSEKEIRDLIETVPVMVFSIRPDGSTEFVSRNWQDYAGLSLEHTTGQGWQATVHPEDLETHLDKWRVSMASGLPFENEVRHRNAKGVYRWFLVRAVPLRDDHGKVLKWYGTLTDIEDRKRAEALLTGEKRILEMVAKGDTLAQILDSLCRLVEEQASDVLTSILLVEGSCLRHGGAPSLPKAYTEAIDGVVIGPAVGSCGTAAYRGEQVIVEDIASDPLWVDYREAALPHSLRACWSTPIFSAEGKVIATFAMYYREPRTPSHSDQEIIEQITHLAGAAIERKLTQEALRRSEAHLAEAQRLSHTGSWAFNPLKTKAHYWSDEMFRIWGFDPQQGPPDNTKVLQRIHVEDRERIRELFERAYAGDLKVDVVEDHRIVLDDGTLKHIHGISRPVFDEAGRVVEYIGTAIDVTERRRAEAALRRSEAYLAESQRLTKTGSWAYNPFTRQTLYWSAEMFRIFGLDPAAGPSSEKFWQRVHPEDLNRVKARVESEAHRKTGYDDEYRIVLPDGTVKHILDIGRPVINGAGEVLEFVGTTVDVTERKHAEQALRRSESYLAEAQRLTRTGSWARDPRLDKMLYCSEELYRIFGLDAQEHPPSLEVFLQRVHPDDREKWRENDFRGGLRAEQTLEYRVQLPDGSVKHVLSKRHPVFDESGELVEIVGTTIDVTESKRAEEQLRESEGRFRTIFENAGAGVALVDGQGHPIKCNPAYMKMMGYTEEELRSMVFTQLTHPDDVDLDWSLYLEVLDGKRDRYEMEKRYIKKDGQVMWGQLIVSRVKNKDGSPTEYMVGMVEDITERKRAEEALRRSEAYLAEAQRLTHTGSWAWNPNGDKGLYWSEETFRIFGLDPKAGVPTGEAFRRCVHPQDHDRLFEITQKAISEKRDYVVDHRIVLPDGTVKHIQSLGHPVVNASGEVLEYVGTAIDVTERKRAEAEREKLRQIEADLARINRVRMMGELTASLAHEIKQPIAAAVSNAEACLQWLARDQPDLREVREAATEMVREAKRAAEIITRVRSLFKKEEIARAILDVNHLIAETVSLVREEADRRSITVRTELDTELPRIAADRVQLQQVLINLMLNGIEAMNGTQGELIIRSRRDEEGRPLISVSDAGMGLPLAQKDKIFDAFFTTKAQGTGMGLAISRSIVESHGGRLWATANSGRGATFYFTLPNEAAEAA